MIDFVLVILLIVAIYKGLRNGFVLAIFSFLAFVIGLAAALKLSTAVADYLGTSTNVSHRWLPVLAFAIVFLIVVFLVRLSAKAIESALKIVMLGWLNKLGGILFYSFLYLFIFSIILFYTTQLHLLKPETIQASTTYSYIEPVAPKLMSGLGMILPFFKNMFAELENFFGKISSHSSQ
jgi:membrane protein required for colicin V production